MRSKVYMSLAIAAVIALLSSCGKSINVKPNILLITIDTLRRDHLGIYGYPRETSPFIDKMAREGMMFKHAVTPIPLTAPSVASILTSLHPLTHGVLGNTGLLTGKVQTIAEVLKQSGYYTIGSVGVLFLSSKYNFSQGFDSFSDKWVNKSKKGPSAHRIAQSVNESLFKQIDEYLENPEYKKKPLFIWVHYYDPHWNYRDIKSITFKTELRDHPYWKFIKLYDKEIRYTDEHIEKLYRYLDEKKLCKRMVTCISADHGEEFGERIVVHGHADFYSENTLVPLIFHGYGIPKNKVIEECVSTLDIPVTLLGISNQEFADHIEGIDLLKTFKKPGAYKERRLLIIGKAGFTRSLQLLHFPWAYILNLDHHYKYWYISEKPNLFLPQDRFKPIKKNKIKREKNIMVIPLPYVLKEGLNYAVFQASIENKNGIFLHIKMLPYSFTKKIQLRPGVKTFSIIYPVAIRDRILVNIEPKQGSFVDIDNMKVAFISKQEFQGDLDSIQIIENKIYRKFPTLRKNKEEDEFFNLSSDIGMKDNLVKSEQFKSKILKYHKMSYTAYKYYYQKGRKLMSGKMTKENLTEEEKKILKSLGYL
jgi:hypothetical protein